jgi:hypothetical protein
LVEEKKKGKVLMMWFNFKLYEIIFFRWLNCIILPSCLLMGVKWTGLFDGGELMIGNGSPGPLYTRIGLQLWARKSWARRGQFDLLERMKTALTPSARSISHPIWAWAFPVARQTLSSKIYVTTLSAASFHFLFTNYPP